jgi:hypothetical protein
MDIEQRIRRIFTEASGLGFDYSDESGVNYIRSVVANEMPELNWKEIEGFIAGEIIDQERRRR